MQELLPWGFPKLFKGVFAEERVRVKEKVIAQSSGTWWHAATTPLAAPQKALWRHATAAGACQQVG